MMPDFGHVAFNTTAHSYPALATGDSIEDFLTRLSDLSDSGVDHLEVAPPSPD